MPDDKLYSIPQVSRILSLSQPFVKVLISDGRLGSVKVGRARRISKSQLNQFIEKTKDESFFRDTAKALRPTALESRKPGWIKRFIAEGLEPHTAARLVDAFCEEQLETEGAPCSS